MDPILPKVGASGKSGAGQSAPIETRRSSLARLIDAGSNSSDGNESFAADQADDRVAKFSDLRKCSIIKGAYERAKRSDTHLHRYYFRKWRFFPVRTALTLRRWSTFDASDRNLCDCRRSQLPSPIRHGSQYSPIWFLHVVKKVSGGMPRKRPNLAVTGILRNATAIAACQVSVAGPSDFGGAVRRKSTRRKQR
jgi:hypothetical protein